MKEKLTKVILRKKGETRRGKTNWNRINKMTEAEILSNALSDEDNPPLSDRELSQFRPAKVVETVDVKGIREHLGPTQEEFAYYFGVSVKTLRDWEQHRHKPNQMAINFLIVVAKEPRAVQRALSGSIPRTVSV